ncbi:hypothetical protein IWW52_005608 [Coemansia sp. RSA 2704]|nr:hypothetical protein IWW52_005608 [Coemansia sp. RSA 2704]
MFSRLVAMQRRQLAAARGRSAGSRVGMCPSGIHTAAVILSDNSDRPRDRDGRSASSAKHASGSDEDMQSLESLFDMFDSADNARPDSTAKTPPLKDQVSSKAHDRTSDSADINFDDLLSVISQNRSIDRDAPNSAISTKVPRFKPAKARKLDLDDDDLEIDDLSATDEPIQQKNAAFNRRAPANHNQRDDPMQEFERILADMAGSGTEAYKASKPAPLFWDEKDVSQSQGKDASFLDELNPQSLFENEHRISAYSAGKLVGDPSQISQLAKRVQQLSQKAQEHDHGPEPIQGRRQRTTDPAKLDRELEQNQLSALTSCRSVPALSKFVFMDLLSRKASATKGLATARPSPTVYAETVRRARELKAPSIGFYLYGHCRTRMGLADRLRVLNHEMYSELLITAWRSKSDISAVLLIIQDVIAMGVVGRLDMERQIDQIAVELRKVFNMPNIADLVLSLKSKIAFSSTFSAK